MTLALMLCLYIQQHLDTFKSELSALILFGGVYGQISSTDELKLSELLSNLIYQTNGVFPLVREFL